MHCLLGPGSLPAELALHAVGEFDIGFKAWVSFEPARCPDVADVDGAETSTRETFTRVGEVAAELMSLTGRGRVLGSKRWSPAGDIGGHGAIGGR